jgi:rhodanese-related sulfurtransferase
MINFDLMFDDQKDNYRKILGELRGGKARLIDIREQSEWEQNRFKCAMHIPLSELSKGAGIEILKDIKRSNKKIYLHCRSGNRAREAQKILAQYGCTKINVIPISMLEMLEEGFLLTS